MTNKVLIQVLKTILYMLFPPLWVTAFFKMPVYEKHFKNKATTIFNCYILPPLAVVAIFFGIFYYKDIYPFGKKTIAWCDMTQQGVPYLLNFKSVLEGDDSLFLNMANAAGMDGWSLFRAYFARPFNYLVLFIEPAEAMDFISVITVLKLAACSATAMVFFRTCIKKLDPAIAAVLSMMYSFCAFGTMYYQILNWPDAMYILPLYFAGLYLLIKEHKIALFTVSLAFVMLNFSFGFMTVVATLLLLGHYTVSNGDLSEVKRTAFEFTAGSALAAILCAPSWLSFFGAYNDSARGVDLESTLASSALFTTKNTAYPLLMSTAFIFLAVFAYKAYKKDALGKALYFLFGMMMIPMVIEPINKMWHAGSYMGFPNRYAFIIIFSGLVIAGIVLSRIREASPIEATDKKAKNSLVTSICASVLVLSVCYFLYKFVFAYTDKNFKAMGKYASTLWGDSTSYKHMLIVMCIFLLVYALCYFVYKKGWVGKRAFAMFMLTVVVCEAYVSVNTYVVPATSKVKTENFREYGDLAYRIEDDDFYRVKNTGFLNAAYSISEANFPGAIGYNCMGHYSSFTSENYLYAAKAYGYSSVWMKIESYGGTKFSDALFNVKYEIGKIANKPADVVYSNSKYYIAETEQYLPIGVFTDINNPEIDVNNVTRMQLQEKVFDAITNGKSDLFEYVSPDKLTNCKLVDNGKKYSITTSGSDSYIDYTVEIKGTKTLYFDCFDQFSNSLSEKINGSFDVYVNNKRLIASFPKDTSNGLLNLGTFTDATVDVRLKVLKNVSARSFGVYAMDDKALDKAIAEISTANLQLDGNEVYGSYTAKESGYIFISLPYNPKYNCRVNGKSVTPIKAFGGFTAVPVAVGENTISLSYTTSMFYPSMIMMIVGIAIAILVLVLMKKKKSASFYEFSGGVLGDKATGILSMIAYIGVIVCFIAVILAVYVYPMYLKLGSYF